MHLQKINQEEYHQHHQHHIGYIQIVQVHQYQVIAVGAIVQINVEVERKQEQNIE